MCLYKGAGKSIMITVTVFVFLTETVFMKKAGNTKFRYQNIADELEGKIRKGLYAAGDRLPSVRALCREYDVSMNTVLQAYYQLESKLLVESRPQSGYYVAASADRGTEIPETSNPPNSVVSDKGEYIIGEVYGRRNSTEITYFSMGVPSPELLPVSGLNKSVASALRKDPGSCTGYEDIKGNQDLRRELARRHFHVDGRLKSGDLITTTGCMGALSFCLMALTERGDTIAVESPVYFGILQLARSLGLNVVELPTHPADGLEIDALKPYLEKGKLKACIVVSNFNNPLGSCMPSAHKKALVELVEKYDVPLIEDDLYGDVWFGDRRPETCKSFDESGLVLWCGSVSKTLAPGYRVGWVAPGKYLEKLVNLKLFHTVSSNTLAQAAIADFLEKGRYEAHLKRLRHTLHINSLRFRQAISTFFPEGTKVSQPSGGFVLWVELNPSIDTFELYTRALKQGISIAPGRMFTLQNQFNNCLRLSYGMSWNESVEQALRKLGELARSS